MKCDNFDAPVIRYASYSPDPVDDESYRRQTFTMDKDGNEKFHYDEGKIAEWYALRENLRFYKGQFYALRGVQDIDMVDKDIYETIKPYVKSNLPAKTKAIVNCLAKEAYKGRLPVNERLIPCMNGELEVGKEEWTFTTNMKYHVPYRLPIRFAPFDYDYPTETFDKWLNDLLEPDDQLTLQEYIGYCLLPTTAAQKSLFLIGEGETGKSRVGTILNILLGDALLGPPEMAPFLEDKFKLAEIENKLVLYDDDLDDAAMQRSGIFKKLVTNTAEIMVERKYERPFNITPYARFVACGNTMLTSMYDRTDGFFRRLLPLSVKPRDPARETIANMDELLRKESAGITQWALLGLYRLMCNDWKFTVSDRTLRFLGQTKSMANHYPEFLETAFDFGGGHTATSEEIAGAYKTWCDANSIEGTKYRALQKWLTDNAEKYRLKYSTNIPNNGRHVRGYYGLKVKDEWRKRGGFIRL